MSNKRTLVYTRFERFWHWCQASLILFLALTGFEIHGSIHFFGFEQAVSYHSAAAMALLVLIAFAIFWHFTTGEWKQYIPTRQMVVEQAQYYITGIFQGAPHPTKKTALSKLNPLQRLVYLGLKILVIPVVVASGLLYMLYRYPQRYGVESLDIDGLYTVAVIHVAGAFALMAFVIAHIYLTTTGETPTSNLEAMITGYEELHDDSSGAHSASAMDSQTTA